MYFNSNSFLLSALASLPLLAAQELGRWSDLIKLPVIPVAAYIVPQYPRSEKVLFFSAFANDTFSGPRGRTQFAEYNHRTGAIAHREVANTQHDMFCPGMSLLSDGRLVITGGSDAAVTSIYDPSNNGFTRGPDMKKARGYQSSTTLSNGRIFTIGGSYSGGYGGKDGEVYNPSTNQWTLLSGAQVQPMLTTDHEGIWREDNHGWLFGWKNGYVFQAGPSKNMHWYGTSGSGSVKDAGTRDSIASAMCGVNVMYDAGKIFSAGGTPDYTDSPATSRAHIITIGEPNQLARVEQVPDMNYPRGFANAVALPDGKILITGGQTYARVFTDADAVLTPELFDPVTKTYTKLANEAVPRNYHSVSILLPDATVFHGGGGMCYIPNGADASSRNCDRSVDHPDGQIFTPPYLLKNGQLAPRPSIEKVSTTSSTSGTSITVGGRMTVTMKDSAANLKFALVRIGSVTHSINTDQRRIPLAPTSASGTQATIRIPSDAGILLPGPYYLFALSSDGVPSIAWTMLVRN